MEFVNDLLLQTPAHPQTAEFKPGTMTNAEYDTLPAPVACWLDSLYIAADGQSQKSQSVERTIQDGTVQDVIRRYKVEKDLDEHYEGKL